MFTVTVSNLPEDCTEEDLVEHFGKICPQHKIANVSMAYDNAREIEECVKRGDIIRAKVRAVHVSKNHHIPFVQMSIRTVYKQLGCSLIVPH